MQDVSAFSYVSKYCTKGDLDSETYRNLLSAVNRLDGYTEEQLKVFRYNCRPVIRSSKNFGLYLLSITDYNDLENGYIKMPDKKYTEKMYPLPLTMTVNCSMIWLKLMVHLAIALMRQVFA